MKTDMFFMKVLTTESPYYQIIRGNFRYETAVMQKADELKQDSRVQKIVIKKRDNMRAIPKTYYKWDQGFETIYLGK